MTLFPPPATPAKRQQRLPIVTFSDNCDYDGMWGLVSGKCVDIHFAGDRSPMEGVVVAWHYPQVGDLTFRDHRDDNPVGFLTGAEVDEFSDRIERIEYL